MWIAALWNATGNINTNRPGSSVGDGGDDTSQLGYILWLMPNEMESNLCIRDSQYKLRIDVHTTALIITHSQHLSLAPHRHQSPRPKIIMIVSKGVRVRRDMLL